jgi:hypothetical protein
MIAVSLPRTIAPTAIKQSANVIPTEPTITKPETQRAYRALSATC